MKQYGKVVLDVVCVGFYLMAVGCAFWAILAPEYSSSRAEAMLFAIFNLLVANNLDDRRVR
jgi:hypothetical protein